MDPAADRPGFLTLAEAAGRLGVSRLKLREAVAKGLVPARRDNEGRLRVDLTAVPPDLATATAAAAASPEALMEALFDEIEELQAEAADDAGALARLMDLAGRQQAALARATDALDASRRDAARLAALLERAVALAEASETRGPDPAADRAADRALTLLEDATAALEASRADGARLAGLLGRAMDATARLEAENARLARDSDEKAGVIDAQEGMVNKLFSLSESALEAASRVRPAQPRGLLARVFGRRGGPE